MSEVAVDTKYRIETKSNKSGFILPEELRSKADRVISEIDFPTSRTEKWKYTRVAKIKNTLFTIPDREQVQAVDMDDFLIPDLPGSVLVFVNGFYMPTLSTITDESGLEITTMASKSKETHSMLGKLVPLENELFNAINTYYSTDGVLIRIRKNTNLQQSIQLICVTTGKNTYAGNRNIIICEDFASAHVVMNFVSGRDADTCFTNAVSEIHVGTNAALRIDKIQQEAASNLNIISEYVDQEKDAVFSINTITLDGGLVRNNLTIGIRGENSETNLSGAYILRGKQHVDNHTVVDHKVPHCLSNELYKGVIDEQATAVFNGKVFVRKDAQKINAFQSNGNVLLSDQATVNSKPELEIYADDVKCSHGSTTGQLDDDAIFYLRARGISEKGARALMVSAFIGDVLEKIENEAVRDYVYTVIEEKFGWQR